MHDYTLAIDSVYVDLKRAIVFSLKAVMVELDYVQASNDIKFESFLNHVNDGATSPSRFSAALLAEPQTASLVSFVRTHLAPLREVNAQRTTIEHFDLHYGGHHEVEMSWPGVTENVGPIAPHAISRGLTKKGVAMRDHLDAQVALVYDWMKLCGDIAASRALTAATKRAGATTGVA